MGYTAKQAKFKAFALSKAFKASQKPRQGQSKPKASQGQPKGQSRPAFPASYLAFAGSICYFDFVSRVYSYAGKYLIKLRSFPEVL